MSVCLSVCLSLWCVHACIHACVRARARVRACVCVCVCVCLCLCLSVTSLSVPYVSCQSVTHKAWVSLGEYIFLYFPARSFSLAASRCSPSVTALTKSCRDDWLKSCASCCFTRIWGLAVLAMNNERFPWGLEWSEWDGVSLIMK